MVVVGHTDPLTLGALTMKKVAIVAAAALVGVGSLVSTGAEARGRGGAVAAGLIGGLAAGALLGAAASNAYAAPTYSYGYGYPDYGYGYAPAYRTRRVVRSYDYDYDYVPVYRTRRVVRSYDYGYAPAGYSWGGPTYYGW